MTKVSHQQFFKLCEWLKEHKDEIEGCEVKNDILPRANEAMKFTVTDSAIKSAREATGLNFGYRSKPIAASDDAAFLAMVLMTVVTVDDKYFPRLKMIAERKQNG